LALRNHQYDLEHDGRDFFLDEAKKSNDFFLLGELQGENEIPALLAALWPQMWKEGYRHQAPEVSPRAAHELELVPLVKGPVVRGLWTKEQQPLLTHSIWKRSNRSFSSANWLLGTQTTPI
jgi:hypothetical protein